MKTAPRPRAWPLSAIEGRRPAVAGGRYRRRRPPHRRPAERRAFVPPRAAAPPPPPPPPLRRAFQHVAMAWPPPASVKTAVLAIIDHWSNDTALDDPSKAAAATRRLQRARAILEEWSQRRETP